MMRFSLPLNPSNARSSKSRNVAEPPPPPLPFVVVVVVVVFIASVDIDDFIFAGFFPRAPSASSSPSLPLAAAAARAFAAESLAALGSSTSKLMNPSSVAPSMSALEFTSTAFQPSSRVIHPSSSSSSLSARARARDSLRFFAMSPPAAVNSMRRRWTRECPSRSRSRAMTR